MGEHQLRGRVGVVIKFLVGLVVLLTSQQLVKTESSQFPLAVGCHIDLLGGEGEVDLFEGVVDERNSLKEGVEVEFELKFRRDEVGELAFGGQHGQTTLHPFSHEPQDVVVLGEGLHDCQYSGVSHPQQLTCLLLGQLDYFFLVCLLELLLFDEEDGGGCFGLFFLALEELPVEPDAGLPHAVALDAVALDKLGAHGYQYNTNNYL